MKIRINVDKTAAIKSGNEHYGVQIVDMPLSAITDSELLAELAQCDETNGEISLVSLHIDGRYTNTGTTHAAATPDAVITELRARIAARQQVEAHNAAVIEHVRLQLSTQSVEQIAKNWWGQDNAPNCHSYDCSPGQMAEAIKLPAIAALMAQVREYRAAKKAEAEKRDSEESARSKLAADEAAREKAAGEQTMREWAQAMGSERLKLMLTLNAGDWLAVAVREYQDANAPDGYSHGSLGGKTREKPTLPELQELQSLRALCDASNGTLSDATIDWVAPREEYDPETGEQIEEPGFAVAECRINAPNGASSWCHKKLT